MRDAVAMQREHAHNAKRQMTHRERELARVDAPAQPRRIVDDERARGRKRSMRVGQRKLACGDDVAREAFPILTTQR